MTAVYGDGVAAIVNALRTALAERDEPYAQDVSVGTQTPRDRRPHDTPPPQIVVSQDGPGVDQRANSRALVRLTVWHSTRDDAFDLCALAYALAQAHRGEVVRGVLPGSTPWATSDPDTDEPMAWATVRANVRPINL